MVPCWESFYLFYTSFSYAGNVYSQPYPVDAARVALNFLLFRIFDLVGKSEWGGWWIVSCCVAGEWDEVLRAEARILFWRLWKSVCRTEEERHKKNSESWECYSEVFSSLAKIFSIIRNSFFKCSSREDSNRHRNEIFILKSLVWNHIWDTRCGSRKTCIIYHLDWRMQLWHCRYVENEEFKMKKEE